MLGWCPLISGSESFLFVIVGSPFFGCVKSVNYFFGGGGLAGLLPVLTGVWPAVDFLPGVELSRGGLWPSCSGTRLSLILSPMTLEKVQRFLCLL
jgi:hypothetical protein